MSLRHLVLFKYQPHASPAAIAALEAAFCALAQQVPTLRALEWGADVSPEGLAKGFQRAFLLSFDDAAGRDAYLPHPAHQTFVAQAQPLLEDVLVIDYFALQGAPPP